MTKLSEQQIQSVLREAERMRPSPIDPEIAWQEELRLRIEQGDLCDADNLAAIARLMGRLLMARISREPPDGRDLKAIQYGTSRSRTR